jgi:hypothetical protein
VNPIHRSASVLSPGQITSSMLEPPVFGMWMKMQRCLCEIMLRCLGVLGSRVARQRDIHGKWAAVRHPCMNSHGGHVRSVCRGNEKPPNRRQWPRLITADGAESADAEPAVFVAVTRD